MHFLMVQQGTAGEIYPRLGIALELKRRGHRVSFITNTHFGALIRNQELEFIDLGQDDHYQLIHTPEFWHPAKSSKVIASFQTGFFRRQYECVAAQYKPGETVAIISPAGMGARIAQEKLGVPTVSVPICPWELRSMTYPSDQPSINLIPLFRHDPTTLATRIYFWLGDRFFVDPLFGPVVNRMRQELGLPPLRRVCQQWLHSPQLIVGLFPRWFAEPYPPDWPGHLHLTQFPLFDNTEAVELPESIRQYLSAGDPPVVFSPGTATAHLNDFFSAAIDACRILRRRGLLLTRFREQLPEKLPEYVRHEAYVPLSLVLCHSAALVSHGGIGSASQAMAAGIPQLVMPMVSDQPDNARRLKNLGVARTLHWKKLNGKRMAKELNYLLQSAAVRENCLRIQERFPKGNLSGQAADIIEEFSERVGRLERKNQPQM